MKMDQQNENEMPFTIGSQHILKIDPASPSNSPFKTNFEHSVNQSSFHQHNHSQSLVALPPTPMTAYFDAEDVGDGFDEENEYTLSSSSSPPTPYGRGHSTFGSSHHQFDRSPIYGNARSNHGELRSNYMSSIAIKTRSSDHTQPTNMSESDNNETSEGNRSLSSETDSPGPITPATPSHWKPKELTLLRSRKGTLDSDASGQGNTSFPSTASVASSSTTIPTLNSTSNNDKAPFRTLEGLGIRGIQNANSNEIINRRSSRMIARDILPPITTSSPAAEHQRPPMAAATAAVTSNGSNGVHPPRELRLAASTGPPSSARMYSRIPVSSMYPHHGSASSSFTAPQSVCVPSSSRIPVRRGPAFSPISHQNQFASFVARNSAASTSTMWAKDDQKPNEPYEMKSDKVTPKEMSSNVDALTLDEGIVKRQSHPSLLLSESSQRLSRSVDDLQAMLLGDQSIPMMNEGLERSQQQEDVSSRKSLLTSVEGPGSQTPSFAQSLSSGSRRRKPPAPLVLSPSSPSTYSHSSAGHSQPNSALSMSGKPSHKTPSNHSIVTISTEDENMANNQIQKPSSKSSASLAPKSANLSVVNTPISAIGDHFTTPLQSPADRRSGSGLQSIMPHTAEDHETFLKAVSRVKEQMHDLFGEESSSSLDEKWKVSLSSNETKMGNNNSMEKTMVKSPSLGTKSGLNTTHDEDARSIISQLETPSIRSSEVGNAFEFDNISDTKNSMDRQELQDSSDSSFSSYRPPSPEPLLNFNREIFTSVQAPVQSKQRSNNNLQKNADVENLTRSEPPQKASGLPAALPPSIISSDAPLTVPLSVISGESANANKSKSTSPTLRSPKRISSQVTGPRRGSSPSVDMGAAVERSQANVSPTNTRMTVEQFIGHIPNRQHRSKPSIVPAVPSFGYLGPSTSRESTSNSSPLVSNAPINPFKQSSVQHEEEQLGTSRWSSGSEDEDDRPKSGRKSIGNRSKKGSQSGATPSALSSRRNTQNSSSSSLVPLKKSGLFAGLGLRKKSIPAFASDVSNQSSPMILASDSPALNKGDSMKEFPFPEVQQQHQQPRLSLATSVRSNASNLPPSPIVSSPINSNRPWPSQQVPDSQGSLRHIQRQASTPLLRDRFSSLNNGNMNAINAQSAKKPNQLTPRPSDASLATTASSQSATRATSTGSNDSSVPSPAVDRSMQFGPHGLGIQVAPERSTTDSIVDNKPFHLMENRSRSSDAGIRLSMKSHQSGESISTMNERFEKHIAAVTSARLQYEQKLQRQSHRDSKRGSRQRSMTLSSGERLLMDARNAALRTIGVPHSAIPPPIPFFPATRPTQLDSDRETDSPANRSEDVHGRMTTSPDETPRIAYASLSNSSHTHDPAHTPDRTKTNQLNNRRRPTDEDDGLFAMGQALVNSTSSPSVSSAAHKEWLHSGVKSNEKTSKHRRIRATAPSQRPRYPSLTDFGREWQLNHPQEAFFAALGPALLDMTLRDANETPSSTTTSSSSSASNTDDYGSSEQEKHVQVDGRASRGRAIIGSINKQGRDELSSDDEQKRGQIGQDIKQETYSDLESSDSEDSYGISEDESSHIDPRVIAGTSGKAKIEDLLSVPPSDDVPLGRQIRDPKETLKMLQRSQTLGAKKGKGKSGSVSSGKMELSSAKLSDFLDASALTDRLLMLQRSHSENSSRKTPSEKPLPNPFANSQKIHSTFSPGSGTYQPSSDGATMYTASEMRSSGKQSEDERSTKNAQSGLPQSEVVSDFAQTVRLRSQNRSRMRPVAMNFAENVVIPSSNIHSSSDAANANSTERSNERGYRSSSKNEQENPNLKKDNLQQNFASSKSNLVEYRIRVPGSSSVKQHTIQEHPLATARDLIRALMRTDVMPVDGKIGGWAIFDVCPELGIERPMREYEKANEVIETRFNPTLDHFSVRRSDLAPYLSMQALPKTSPALAGWLYVQENGRKRGWNKRWVELRDQAIYQAKSEKGREEVKVCDLTSYDVFVPIEGESWTAKAPKKNAFALRSLIKREEDSVTYFCLSDARAARHWITAINRSRTFQMKSEKPHLFIQKDYQKSSINPMKEVPADNHPKAQSAGMPAPPIVPQRPLVNFNAEIFERGSLLDNVPASNEIVHTSADQREQQSNMIPPPRGSSTSHRKPVSGQNEKIFFPSDEEQKRKFDQVREMERIQRSLGKPLIGVVPEKSQRDHQSNTH